MAKSKQRQSQPSARDKHAAEPTHTNPDGGSEGSRRTFTSELAAIVIGAVVGLAPLAAGIFSFLDPLRGKRGGPAAFAGGSGGREGYIRVAALAALTPDAPPQRFPVIANQADAWNFAPHQPVGAVFVQRVGENQVRVLNATCPHAGCSVSSDGAAFLCPCHNSAFNLDGSKRESESGRENPSPRPLDLLAVDDQKLAEGEIWVEFKEFYTGRKEQIPKQ